MLGPRDGSNGSANLPVTGRTTYPAWADRTYTHTFQAGPAVNATFPLGHCVDDYVPDSPFTCEAS